jgi:hypothetical protein
MNAMPVPIGSRGRSTDPEDELLARLEALNVQEPWRLAEPPAIAGVDQAWLAVLGYSGSLTLDAKRGRRTFRVRLPFTQS